VFEGNNQAEVAVSIRVFI